MFWGFEMGEEKRAVVVSEIVQVGDDDFQVMVIVTRPSDPVISRDMSTIEGEVQRLLPGWIKSKIQAGDP